MMDKVVNGLPHDNGAWSIEENLLASLQRPVHAVIGVLRRGDGLPCLFDIAIERLEKVLGLLVGISRIAREVERRLRNGVGDPAGHSGYELGQVRQRKRFRVRLELPLFGRHALDHSPRGPHFLIEFRQQCIGNGHTASSGPVGIFQYVRERVRVHRVAGPSASEKLP